jgi:hypothetical protein
LIFHDALLLPDLFPIPIILLHFTPRTYCGIHILLGIRAINPGKKLTFLISRCIVV